MASIFLLHASTMSQTGKNCPAQNNSMAHRKYNYNNFCHGMNYNINCQVECENELSGRQVVILLQVDGTYL